MKDIFNETLDTITPEQWRELLPAERTMFINSWHNKGVVSFRCMACGYPTAHGQSRCEACRDHPEIRAPEMDYRELSRRLKAVNPGSKL